MLPKTIKEIRLHVPGVVSFGVFKPLNERDLLGVKAGAGFVFPAFLGGLMLEYRHYFKDFNSGEKASSFLYTVKPYVLGFWMIITKLNFQQESAVESVMSGNFPKVFFSDLPQNFPFPS